jgi:predicted RNA-binding Zn-ribbon protein involved in translation (DUF1610 family)
MEWVLFLSLVAAFIIVVVLHMDWRIRQIAVLMQHYHKDTTRCPECDHPAIGASFCEETTYFCPQCGEKFIWKSKNGKYILSTSIDGDARE